MRYHITSCATLLHILLLYSEVLPELVEGEACAHPPSHLLYSEVLIELEEILFSILLLVEGEACDPILLLILL